MPLAGRAVMMSWSDVSPEDRPAFYEWHNREHMPGAMALAGFQRGRRYIAVKAERSVLNFYEVDSLAVLTGDEYRAKANHPSELTLRTNKLMRNPVRGLAHVHCSLGSALGGFVVTLRLDAEPGREEELGRHLAQTVLPGLVATPEVLGAHYLVSDMPASTYVSTERVGRATDVPPRAIIVEGIALESLDRACDVWLAEESLLANGARGPMVRGSYRHEVSMAKLPNML
jgi:hypothetical protein